MSEQYVTGDGRSLSVSEISDIYRNCVNLAIPTKGRIQRLDDLHYSVTCHFSTTDCDSEESIKTSKTYSLKTIARNKERCIESVRCITDPLLVGETLVVTSNNGRYIGRLKNHKTQTDKQRLEIWDRSRLLKVLDIPEQSDHGLINTDGVFSSMSWYPYGNQDKLIYVCQNKRPKFPKFFKHPSEPQDGKLANIDGRYTRTEDWGESLEGVEHMIIAVLDVANDLNITTTEVIGHSLGDVKWLDGMKSVSVAYNEEPRRLGLVHCNNRMSSLVVHDWSHELPMETLSLRDASISYHAPRVDHSGRRFVYLTCPNFGPHQQSVKMHLHDLNTNQDQELVDKSEDRKDLFIDNLVEDCFTADDQHILFVDFDTLNHHLCLFDLSRSRISRIKFPTVGLSLLDMRYDVILAVGSEVNATPTLFVATLSATNRGDLVAWHQIEDSIHFDEIDYKSAKIPTSDGKSFISTLFVSPRVDLIRQNSTVDISQQPPTQSDLPTIVVIHGGPHAAFNTSYMPHLIFFCRLGLRFLMINYRGSTGVSQSYLETLCGRVGDLDVNDSLHAIRHYVAAKQVNPKKLIVSGGSHGGFLACHLSCQTEFKFTSAIIRNPVTDIAAMYETTDVPDWCYSEALGCDAFKHDRIHGPDELVRMFKCSPVSRIRDANVPTLMLLGSKDKRVPMFQGERWYQMLKAKGVKSKCKIYEDNHALGKVETHLDSNINMAMWMLSNL